MAARANGAGHTVATVKKRMANAVFSLIPPFIWDSSLRNSVTHI